MSQLHWLDCEEIWFPPSSSALKDPDGLLAVGGDLSPERLIAAYSQGIFPWYSEGQPLLWWTPDPRMILTPGDLHLGRTTRKLLRKHPFRITVNTAFETVMRHCGTISRKNQDGSWITEEMVDAYLALHHMGVAHSIEAWNGDTLAGGLYGVALGRAYFGESMFSLESGASRVAFSTLAAQLRNWQFELIDCQIQSDYLSSFGAREVPRQQFENHLGKAVAGLPRGRISQQLTVGNQNIALLAWETAWQMPETGFDGTFEA